MITGTYDIDRFTSAIHKLDALIVACEKFVDAHWIYDDDAKTDKDRTVDNFSFVEFQFAVKKAKD